ncbi:DUF5677 domain-containing protein [Caulobacter vibrioides]|uniref:DUF5677 domain-containing protein n=1 Tax=Caulobacter vibrioides TaxID=155892 RepID=UPI0015E6EF60|nr:DUF5677 domain-containing protein [Caulobacter vibrioides]
MSKKSRKRPSMSTLEQHTRAGKTLSPPFKTLPGGVQFSSWRDSRMPCVLWSILLSGQMQREDYLSIFRSVARAARDMGEIAPKSISHHDLKECAPSTFDYIFASVLNNEIAKDALKPLLLYGDLPDLEHWSRHLTDKDKDESIQAISNSVFLTLDHQSDNSTDCRWLRILYYISIGKMSFPEKMRETVENILKYPNSGDLRSVRPSIRAIEMAFAEEDSNSDWPEKFWKQSYENTDCILLRRYPQRSLSGRDESAKLMELYDKLCKISQIGLNSTSIDAKTDAITGLTLYSTALCATIVGSGGDQRVEGRHAIRTMTESIINLRFMLKYDNKTIWEKYRSYGTGQAKLAFLKLFDVDDNSLPNYVKIEDLDSYSDEDMWQELVEINLGSWSGRDLRKMSEEAGIKDIYDKYYGWPSGYIHGHWGAVRDTIFCQCVNPLHRLHRVPSAPNLSMESTMPDMVKILNLHLDVFRSIYPDFKGSFHLDT